MAMIQPNDLVLELTPFQRWLTNEKQMTTEQAFEVCSGEDHELYCRLWQEWEGFRPSILVIHEMPLRIERVYQEEMQRKKVVGLLANLRK